MQGLRGLPPRKQEESERRVSNCVQTIIYSMLSHWQVRDQEIKDSLHFIHAPLPLQVGLAVYIHQKTRQRGLIDVLSRMGLTVSYKKVLSLINALSQSVLCMALQHECGAYIPLDLVRGRQVTYALDNIDFQEDTPVGKMTLHATVSVAYQADESNDADTQEFKFLRPAMISH